MTVNRALQHADSKDFFETPPDVFKEVSEAFGGFDLDTASSDANHLCDRYYTKEQNGLVLPWDGKRWWDNPPYSEKEAFLRKAWEEYKAGHEGVILLPSSQETGWFREYITHPRLWRLVWPRRIQYLIDGKRPTRLNKAGKVVTSGNVGGSVLVHFGKGEPPPLAGEPWVR